MYDTQSPGVAPDTGERFNWRWLLIVLVLLMGLIAIASFFRELRDATRLASCRPYSVTWVTEGYSADHEGMYPPLSTTPGRLMFIEGAEQPYAGAGVRVDFVCESDSQSGIEMVGYPGAPVDDWSYIYLGYVIENQAQLELFAEAYRRIVAEGGDFTEDIKVVSGQGNCGSDTIYRLREEGKLLELLPCLTERLEQVPLVIEWPENHRGPVAKVISMAADNFRVSDDAILRMTGKRKTLAYPGEWPMTEAAIGVLRELDALGTEATTPPKSN